VSRTKQALAEWLKLAEVHLKLWTENVGEHVPAGGASHREARIDKLLFSTCANSMAHRISLDPNELH
jgi:hypothetical protein